MYYIKYQFPPYVEQITHIYFFSDKFFRMFTILNEMCYTFSVYTLLFTSEWVNDKFLLKLSFRYILRESKSLLDVIKNKNLPSKQIEQGILYFL